MKNGKIEIKKNVLLKDYSTFRIGGKARYFVEVRNISQLIEAINWSYKKDIPFFVLGGGSNILFLAKECKELVIRCAISYIRHTNNNLKFETLYAGAGTRLERLVQFSLKESLTGLEWMVGIPGTIGGAVCNNAGAFGKEVKDIVKKVKILKVSKNGLETKTFSNEDCQFSYRSSLFKNNKSYIIIEVELELKKEKKSRIESKIKENLLYRKVHQPLEYPSIGSIFKNIPFSRCRPSLLEKFPDLKQFQNRKEIPAAYLIDSCGLKEKKIGGAQISKKHSNFIINTGKATAEDVMILISLIKQKVRDKFGIQLEEEIIIF